MTIKEKIKGLAKKVLKNPVESVVALGLAGLISITAVKDNVHFGSTTLHNPQENHYVWGLVSTTNIKGDAKGNFYNISLIFGANKTEDNKNIDGGFYAYGLISGVNNTGNNSIINKGMHAYGLGAGENKVGNNSVINKGIHTYGLLVGVNEVGNDSVINKGMYAYGLVAGVNEARNNSVINGNAVSRGIFAITPLSDGFGSNQEIGLKNYVHKTEKTKQTGENK